MMKPINKHKEGTTRIASLIKLQHQSLVETKENYNDLGLHHLLYSRHHVGQVLLQTQHFVTVQQTVTTIDKQELRPPPSLANLSSKSTSVSFSSGLSSSSNSFLPFLSWDMK